jgi:hypothetical protein
MFQDLKIPKMDIQFETTQEENNKFYTKMITKGSAFT